VPEGAVFVVLAAHSGRQPRRSGRLVLAPIPVRCLLPESLFLVATYIEKSLNFSSDGN